MGGGLLGTRRGMNAAHDHRHAARAVGVGDVVSPAGGLRIETDADQVDVLHVARAVERSHHLVGVDHLVRGRRECGEDAEAESRQRRRRGAHRCDQLDLHASPLSSAPPRAETLLNRTIVCSYGAAPEELARCPATIS